MNPPGGIDLGHGQLHAFFVRLQEGRLRLVAVDFTDPDRRLRLCRNSQYGHQTPGAHNPNQR